METSFSFWVCGVNVRQSHGDWVDLIAQLIGSSLANRRGGITEPFSLVLEALAELWSRMSTWQHANSCLKTHEDSSGDVAAPRLDLHYLCKQPSTMLLVLAKLTVIVTADDVGRH